MIPFPHKQHKLLSELTTLGIGGPARLFAEAHTVEQMQQMILYAHQNHLPFLVLGKGSNCLFADEGFEGLVILNRIDFLEQQEELFIVGGGFSFTRLGQISTREGYAGLEFAAGIPASVGGAIYMNAGANKQETADTLISVDYITENGELICFQKEEIHFGYRTSSFQKWNGAIVSAKFRLKACDCAKQVQKEILNYRLQTQPYGDKSAGCAFRNPDGGAAGQLIDACGLKGFQIGGAKVSTLHANFIVNAGGASSSDVKALVKAIKERIFQEKGIVLEEEIRFIPPSTPSKVE